MTVESVGEKEQIYDDDTSIVVVAFIGCIDKITLNLRHIHVVLTALPFQKKHLHILLARISPNS